MDKYSNKVQTILELAKEAAIDMNHDSIGTEHILIGMLQEGENVVSRALNTQGITGESIVEFIKNDIGIGKTANLAPETTPRTRRILQNSGQEAVLIGSNLIGTEHVFISLLKEPNCVALKILNGLQVNIDKVVNDIADMIGNDTYKNRENQKSKNKTQTPNLNKFSRDLTEAARNHKFDPIIGRNDEIERVIQILSRRTKNNPCLTGEPGVGKTAIAEGLAQRIVKGNIPETLKNKRVVTLDLSSMVAGAKFRGDFEDRMKKSIDEVRQAGNIILFVDEIHTMIGAGAAEGSLDAANILKPALSRGEIQLIGATTMDEYRKHIEKDAALERRFQPIQINEPTEIEAIEILNGIKNKYEVHHGVHITDKAINAAVKLSVRYITERFLPDKSIDLIDEACSKVRLKNYTSPNEVKSLEDEFEKVSAEKLEAIKIEDYDKAGKLKKKCDKIKNDLEKERKKWKSKLGSNSLIVDEEMIAQIITSWTGIPVSKLVEEESQKLLDMEETLHKRVIGQDEAVVAVSEAIRRSRVGLKDPKRPVGSFLFLGQTGVGKTELCKALAEILFGKEDSMVRIDMSEYMEKHSVSRLIGTPPGYVGYDDAPQLSEKVRKNPYSVILFDEIEKAHESVIDILLQILEDGRITDSHGRLVDFKNTIIVMTSNVGSKNIVEKTKRMGFSVSKENNNSNIKDEINKDLKAFFKPELLNRIDDILIFNPLTKKEIGLIIDLIINNLNKRLHNNNIQLILTDKAKQYIIDKGYDFQYGARPIRRFIQTNIENELARLILLNKITFDKVKIDCKNNKLVFNNE